MRPGRLPKNHPDERKARAKLHRRPIVVQAPSAPRKRRLAKRWT